MSFTHLDLFLHINIVYTHVAEVYTIFVLLIQGKGLFLLHFRNVFVVIAIYLLTAIHTIFFFSSPAVYFTHIQDMGIWCIISDLFLGYVSFTNAASKLLTTLLFAVLHFFLKPVYHSQSLSFQTQTTCLACMHMSMHA